MRQLPFVRAGAVTCCPGCEHTWSIRDSQITHTLTRAGNKTPAPAASPSAPAKRAKPTQPTDAVADLDPDLDQDPQGGSSVSGLSGLSDLMQDEPAPPAPLKSAPRSTSQSAASPSSRSTQKTARPSAKAASGLSPAAKSGLAVTVGLLAILLLWGVMSMGGAKTDTDSASTAHDVLPVEDVRAAEPELGPEPSSSDALAPSGDDTEGATELDATISVGPPTPDPVSTPSAP
ncbi:MAG: hypothetical protein V3V20_10045 [Algisphaera sp.]